MRTIRGNVRKNSRWTPGSSDRRSGHYLPSFRRAMRLGSPGSFLEEFREGALFIGLEWAVHNLSLERDFILYFSVKPAQRGVRDKIDMMDALDAFLNSH